MLIEKEINKFNEALNKIKFDPKAESSLILPETKKNNHNNIDNLEDSGQNMNLNTTDIDYSKKTVNSKKPFITK